MDYYKLKILNNKKKIAIIIIVLMILGVLIFYYLVYYQNKNEEVEILLNNEEENIKNEDEVLFVDIKGYVAVPGVYSFKSADNARVNDLILKAGGLKKEADTSLLNLSKKL